MRNPKANLYFVMGQILLLLLVFIFMISQLYITHLNARVLGCILILYLYLFLFKKNYLILRVILSLLILVMVNIVMGLSEQCFPGGDYKVTIYNKCLWIIFNFKSPSYSVYHNLLPLLSILLINLSFKEVDEVAQHLR